jgi:hybrid cluster-associated redox disulfide protein
MRTLIWEVFILITKDMTITDIVSEYPQTVPVFQEFGMGCFG